MLGRAMMTARRHVVAHHPADRLRPFPVDIAFMSAKHQRQPLAARHAALLHPHARTVIARCDTGLTIRIGAAVDRIVDHPMDGGVARPAPSDVAVVAFCGQIGRSSPCSMNQRSVWRALPSSATLSKTSVIASCTRADPANRLVAGELETRWNKALTRVTE